MSNVRTWQENDMTCFAKVFPLSGIRDCIVCLMMYAAGTGTVVAQEYPVFEGFLGASVSNNDFGADRYTMPGLHMSFALNPRRCLRLVADFAAQYRRTSIRWDFSDEDVRLEEMQFLWGAEYTLRRSPKATPFVHALFGVAGREYYTPSGDWEYPRDVVAVDYGFASGFGGGVDWTLTRRWAIRAPQFDYIITHLRHDQPEVSPIQHDLPVLQDWQHNWRVAFGLVLRVGTRSDGSR